jgi:hypothetical protein
MNPEMIGLYRKVQKYKGEWQIGDRVFNDHYGIGIVLAIPSKNSLDIWWENGFLDHLADTTGKRKYLLWLPPVYSDDERCLVRMIKGAVEAFRNDLGEWGVNCWSKSQEANLIYHDEELHFSGYCKTLPEALLRAIAAKGDVT